MTHEEYIKLAIETEKLHRYVFDNIYVQHYQTTKEDEVILNAYKNLYEQCPDFREVLIEEYKRLKLINPTEHIEHINLSRYGFHKNDWIREQVKNKNILPSLNLKIE
jgi:hypothetical protein